MEYEAERKFEVLDPSSSLSSCHSRLIEQRYLAIGADGEEARLRGSAGSSVLTVKGGRGEERLEYLVELGDDQFRSLWPLTERRRLEERRYLEEGEHAIEVDVYGGDLEGLVVAVIEFPCFEASHGFEPPDWLGEELAGDELDMNQGSPPQAARPGDRPRLARSPAVLICPSASPRLRGVSDRCK
jgi:adenylate cyclase